LAVLDVTQLESAKAPLGKARIFAVKAIFTLVESSFESVIW
jgi:hypothetical protein